MSNQLKGELLSLPLPVLHSRIAVINKLRLRLDEHAFRFENFLVEVGLPLSQRIIPVQIFVLKLRQDLFQVLAFHSFGHGLETTAVSSQIDSYHLALLVLLDL